MAVNYAAAVSARKPKVRPIIKRLFGDNPYGTLGPSPGRVQKVTPGANIAPYTPPTITAPATTPALSGPVYTEPNWNALLAGDPDLLSAESEMNRANLMDRGSLRDAIRQAVIQSGFEVGADEDIDAATLAAARANPFSTRADIETQVRRGAAQSDAELAARGIFSSGQFAQNRGQLSTEGQRATAQGMAGLLQSMQSGRASYTQAVSERRAQLNDLRQQVRLRLMQTPGLGWSQGPALAAPAAPIAPTAPAPAPSQPAVAGAWKPVPVSKIPASAGPWRALYARYGYNVKAGADPKTGRPYVVIGGKKRYA